MSKKCVYCSKKKGKRSCPILKGYICHSCCGENRQSEIRCPDTCHYLVGDKSYYQKRIEKGCHKLYIDTLNSIGSELGESGIFTFSTIGMSIYHYHHNHSDIHSNISDYDLRKGVEALKNEFSVIKLPYQIKSDVGDCLIEVIESERDNPENPPIDNNCIVNVCDRYICLINKISGESMHSSVFKEFLIDLINNIFPHAEESIKAEIAETRKTIEPSIILP